MRYFLLTAVLLCGCHGNNREVQQYTEPAPRGQYTAEKAKRTTERSVEAAKRIDIGDTDGGLMQYVFLAAARGDTSVELFYNRRNGHGHGITEHNKEDAKRQLEELGYTVTWDESFVTISWENP